MFCYKLRLVLPWLFLLILLFSCLDNGVEPWTEFFLSTIDADGNNLNHIVQDVYGNPKFSYDDSHIILSNNDGFYKVNIQNPSISCLLDTLNAPDRLFSVSSIEPEIVFSNSGNIYNINYETEVTSILSSNVNYWARYPKYSPDGQKIVFSTISNEVDSTLVKLIVMDNDGSNIVELYQNKTEGTGRIMFPTFSHDMSKIFFYDYAMGSLFMCDVNGSNLEVIYDVNYYPSSTMEVGGDYLVFNAQSDEIILYNLVTQSILNLGYGRNPSISSDGSKIALHDNGLYIMESDGTSRDKVAASGEKYQFFNKQGDSIVFFHYKNHD